jgi:hypothetical protein
MLDQQLFDSPPDAMMFGLRFTSQQYAQSELAKLQKRTGRSSEKGLVGLDGAAVAGSIKRRLADLDKQQLACIVARYSARVESCPCCENTRMLDEYKESILVLVEWARQFVSGDNTVQRVLFAIVQEYYERRRNLSDVAKSLNIPKRTAYDQKDRIWPHLAQLDKNAQTVADSLLADLCESVSA